MYKYFVLGAQDIGMNKTKVVIALLSLGVALYSKVYT